MRIQLTGQSEWVAVVDEAWEGLARPPHGLSEPAGKLFNWLQQEKNQEGWINRSTIGRQALLRGTSWTADFLASLFTEIAHKTNLGLKAEQKDEEFRISLNGPKPIAPLAIQHGPLNPVLSGDFNKVEFAELERFREQLYDWILEAKLPADATQLTVWHIQDRATLFRCFPLWTKGQWEISTLTGFLSQVALDHGLLWGYAFQHPEPWTYVCGPKQGSNWNDVAASIRKTRALPSLAERYGISAEAAAVVKWFTTLRAKEWLGNLTPSLEENMKKRIGISTDWNEKNLPVYFSILAEEISERTEWKVTVHPWSSGWGNPTHRLLVKRKPTAFEDVVKHVQLLGITEGKILPREKVEVALRSILTAAN